jgi:N-acyl-D-aspartate/D-glutamate deacylase
VEELARISGRPIIFNVVLPLQDRPDVHRELLQWLEHCNNHGMRMIGQGVTVRVPAVMTLYNWSFYDTGPAWREALIGTINEKIEKLGNPNLRRRMLEDMEGGAIQLAAQGGHPSAFVVQGIEGGHPDDFPGVRPYVGMSVQEVAKRQNKHPVDAFIDLALAAGLKTEFLTKGVGVEGDARYAAEIVNSPYAVPGVSDGGAHTKFWTGGAYGTDLLTWLVRDEKLVSLEEAHFKLSYLPAVAAGFRDRGALREGAAADIIVYDIDKLQRNRAGAWWEAEVVRDLPANEWRRVQRPSGYRWIMVNGEITFEEGECTSATPGVLIRSGRT